MMLYLWLYCGDRYGRKKPNTSFWDILLDSVMSGEAITKEACVFAEKTAKARTHVLPNFRARTLFACYRRDARIPTAKRFCRFATMRVANSRLSMLPNSEIRQNEKGERQTQQNESWKSERARYYIISTDLYNHIVLQTIYFRLTESKYSLKSQILEYIIFPLCNCLS